MNMQRQEVSPIGRLLTTSNGLLLQGYWKRSAQDRLRSIASFDDEGVLVSYHAKISAKMAGLDLLFIIFNPAKNPAKMAGFNK